MSKEGAATESFSQAGAEPVLQKKDVVSRELWESRANQRKVAHRVSECAGQRGVKASVVSTEHRVGHRMLLLAAKGDTARGRGMMRNDGQDKPENVCGCFCFCGLAIG